MQPINLIQYLNTEFSISLNEQQEQAVLTDSRYTLLLAVPGSGKTTVLVSRVAELLLHRDVSQEEILTLTFSRESARDMKRRFLHLFSPIGLAPPRFSTIHSFCFSVLKYYAQRYRRQFPEVISDNSKGVSKTALLRQVYQEINGEYLSDDLLETVSNGISLAKNLMYTQAEINRMDLSVEHFYELFAKYEQVKKDRLLMDYDDILTFTLDILQKVPAVLGHFQKLYRYIHVDEAQDTSKIQYEILHLFSQTAGLFLVGDEDQCIYTFRGAYPEGLLEFGKTYPDAEILKIEQNYRSHNDIVESANDFIRINKNRYEKHMFCDNEQQKSIQLPQLDDYSRQYEALRKLIEDEDESRSIAVLYRNHESAVPVIDMLNHNGICYYMREHNLRFFTSFVVKDILSFFTLAYDPKNIGAYERIYYKCMCSKMVFIFVKYNIDQFESVFEAAAACPDIPQYSKMKMREYDSNIRKIKGKRPLSAIQFIETQMGYGEYLSKRYSSGSNPVNTSLKLSILKTVAKGYSGIEPFVENLVALERQLQAGKQDEKNPRVTLSSIHSSKGLEFDTVVLIDLLETILPNQQAIDEADEGRTAEMESEARLFYVAVTRAKSRLVIYTSKFCNDEYVVKSRFVTRLEKEETPVLKNLPQAPEGLAGKEVFHKFFGKGVITSECRKDVLEIYFSKHGTKQVSYSSCLESGILRIAPDKDTF